MVDKAIHQKEVIQAVVEQFNATTGSAVGITRWPDEEERNQRACDAYAEGPGHIPLAIEHTIIPTFDLQKQHDAQFMRAIGGLGAELKHAFPYDLSLTISMFAIQRGQRWPQIKEAVKTWLLCNVAAIPTGRSQFSIPGVPFDISLNRDDDLPPVFTVARWLDQALNVPELLTASIAAALVDKDDQLSRYLQDQNQTLLILESQDIALVSAGAIYQAFLGAYAQLKPRHIDQIWLAETYEPDKAYLFVYCLLAEQAIMDRANPP